MLDLKRFHVAGTWDNRIVWRVHPLDYERIQRELDVYQREHERPCVRPVHILGTPLMADDRVPRYLVDAAPQKGLTAQG
jgi:hypothetical protein